MKSYYEKYGRARLLKLAAHLQEGKLGHDKFDFSEFNGGDFKPNGCGTVGCAIGECPIVFPRIWEFRQLKSSGSAGSISPRLRADNSKDDYFWPSLHDAAAFFGISSELGRSLFFPNRPRAWVKESTAYLKENATRKQVAASIRQFVKWHDKQQVAA